MSTNLLSLVSLEIKNDITYDVQGKFLLEAFEYIHIDKVQVYKTIVRKLIPLYRAKEPGIISAIVIEEAKESPDYSVFRWIMSFQDETALFVHAEYKHNKEIIAEYEHHEVYCKPIRFIAHGRFSPRVKAAFGSLRPTFKEPVAAFIR